MEVRLLDNPHFDLWRAEDEPPYQATIVCQFCMEEVPVDPDSSHYIGTCVLDDE